tara:strand:- start:2456 stop:2773 length:318 start_codon:yes stop_codon:yes gene_type:complete
MKDLMEKSPLASKKFIAYLKAEITWKLVILATLALSAYVIYVGAEVPVAVSLSYIAFQVTIVLTAGFLEVSYIGKQGDLDKFVRLAQITAGGPDSDAAESTDELE